MANLPKFLIDSEGEADLIRKHGPFNRMGNRLVPILCNEHFTAVASDYYPSQRSIGLATWALNGSAIFFPVPAEA